MKSNVANLLVALETLLSKFLPMILAFVVLILVGSILFKMKLTSITSNKVWTINVICPENDAVISQYIAYGKPPEISKNQVIFFNEDGKKIVLTYEDNAVIVTNQQIKESEND